MLNLDTIKQTAARVNRDVQENFSSAMAVTGGLVTAGALVALAGPAGLVEYGVYTAWSGLLAAGVAVAGKVGYDKAVDHFDEDFVDYSDDEDESYEDEEEVEAVSAATLVKDMVKGILYRANKAQDLPRLRLSGEAAAEDNSANRSHGYNTRYASRK